MSRSDNKAPSSHGGQPCCFPLHRATEFASFPGLGCQTCIKDPFHQPGQTFLIIELSIPQIQGALPHKLFPLLSGTSSTPRNQAVSSSHSCQVESTESSQVPELPTKGCSASGDQHFFTGYGPWYSAGSMCRKNSSCHRAESRRRNNAGANGWYPHTVWCQDKH